MLSVLIFLVFGFFALKSSIDGFSKGRIIVSREIKKDDGTVLPAKYVEGRAAKVWAVVLFLIGLGMIGLAILDATGKL